MPNNLKKATKKATYESNVSKLDNIGTDEAEFTIELSIIENILGDFIERIHNNINNEKNFVTTGKINQIDLQAENNRVNVLANKHLIYQDRGVNGSVMKLYDTPHSYHDKLPPVQVFIDWIKDKNIRLINNEKYDRVEGASPFKELTEDEQITKAAWGMAQKVFKEGFKPRNIYSKEIPRLIEDLTEQVGGFAVQQISQLIDVKESAKRIIIKI